MRKIFLVTLLTGALSVAAFAQPDQNATATAANPPNTGQAFKTPEEAKKAMAEAMQKAQQRMADMMKLPPDQQRAMLQNMMEENFRIQMTAFGFKDEALQNSILQFVAEQEKDREAIRQTGAKLYLAMGGKDGLPDQNVSVLLNNYLNAVDDARERREAATKALDDKIGFSQNPRLMAFLTFQGIIGDAAAMTGGMLMMGGMSVAGLNGFLTPPVAK